MKRAANWPVGGPLGQCHQIWLPRETVLATVGPQRLAEPRDAKEAIAGALGLIARWEDHRLSHWPCESVDVTAVN